MNPVENRTMCDCCNEFVLVMDSVDIKVEVNGDVPINKRVCTKCAKEILYGIKSTFVWTVKGEESQ